MAKKRFLELTILVETDIPPGELRAKQNLEDALNRKWQPSFSAKVLKNGKTKQIFKRGPQ